MIGRRVAGLIVAALLPGACTVGYQPARARVRRGPAFAHHPARILALPATCEAEDYDTCKQGDPQAVDSAARMSLEFAGYTLIDSELVNARLGERRERSEEHASGLISSEHARVEVDRVTWADATVSEQKALLADMEVDGFLIARISMGAARGLTPRRTVEVSLVLTRTDDEQVVWQSRCAKESSDAYYTEQAVEQATRCAIDSVAVLR